MAQGFALVKKKKLSPTCRQVYPGRYKRRKATGKEFS